MQGGRVEFLENIAHRLYKGQSYKKIAEELGYSFGSVKHFVNYIYRSCDVHSKIGLRIYIDSHYPDRKMTENEIKKTVKQYI